MTQEDDRKRVTFKDVLLARALLARDYRTTMERVDNHCAIATEVEERGRPGIEWIYNILRSLMNSETPRNSNLS